MSFDKLNENLGQPGILEKFNSGTLKKKISECLIGVMLFNGAILGISGCKTGGSKEKSDKDSEKNVMKVDGIFELGPVRNGEISFRSLDGRYLDYKVYTDSKGNFQIDKEKLRQEMESKGVKSDYVILIGNGGMDIDPDDDGNINNDNDKPVQGKVQTLYYVGGNHSEISITPVSDVFTELVKNSLKNTGKSTQDVKKAVEEVTRSICDKLPDTDNDGEKTFMDFTAYRMTGNNSEFENELRQKGVINGYHTGRKGNRKEYRNSLKKNRNFVREELNKGESGEKKIKLIPQKRGSQILYTLNGDKPDPSKANVYFGDSLPQYETEQIMGGKVLKYAERYEDGVVGGVGQLFYKGSDFYVKEGGTERKLKLNSEDENRKPEDKIITKNISENNVLTGNVATIYPDGDNLQYSKGKAPLHGKLEVNNDGSYKYIPGKYFIGFDNFEIRVTDGERTGSITVNVNVNLGDNTDYTEIENDYEQEIITKNFYAEKKYNEELKQDYENIKSELENIINELKEKENNITNKKGEKENLKERINQLNQKIQDLIDQIENAGEDNEKLEQIKQEISNIDRSRSDGYIKNELEDILNELQELVVAKAGDGNILARTFSELKSTLSSLSVTSEAIAAVNQNILDELKQKINDYESKLYSIRQDIQDKEDQIREKADEYEQRLEEAQDMIDQKENELREKAEDFRQWESDADKYLEARNNWQEAKNDKQNYEYRLEQEKDEYEYYKYHTDNYEIDNDSNYFDRGETKSLGESYYNGRRIEGEAQFTYVYLRDYPAEVRFKLYNDHGSYVKQLGPIEANNLQAIKDFSSAMEAYAKAYIDLKVCEDEIRKYEAIMNTYGSFSGMTGDDIEDKKRRKQNKIDEIREEYEELKDRKEKQERAKQNAINRLEAEKQELEDLKQQKQNIKQKLEEVKEKYQTAKHKYADKEELKNRKENLEEELEQKKQQIQDIEEEIENEQKAKENLEEERNRREQEKQELKEKMENSEGYEAKEDIILGGKVFTITHRYDVDSKEKAKEKIQEDVQSLKDKIKEKIIKPADDEKTGYAKIYYLSENGDISYPMIARGEYYKGGYYGSIEAEKIEGGEEYEIFKNKVKYALESINIVEGGEYNGVTYNVYMYENYENSGKTKVWIEFFNREDLKGEKFYHWGDGGEYKFENFDSESFVENEVKELIDSMVQEEKTGYREGELEGYEGGEYKIYKYDGKIWGRFKFTPNSQPLTTPLKDSIYQARKDMEDAIDSWISERKSGKSEEEAEEKVCRENIQFEYEKYIYDGNVDLRAKLKEDIKETKQLINEKYMEYIKHLNEKYTSVGPGIDLRGTENKLNFEEGKEMERIESFNEWLQNNEDIEKIKEKVKKLQDILKALGIEGLYAFKDIGDVALSDEYREGLGNGFKDAGIGTLESVKDLVMNLPGIGKSVLDKASETMQLHLNRAVFEATSAANNLLDWGGMSNKYVDSYESYIAEDFLEDMESNTADINKLREGIKGMINNLNEVKDFYTEITKYGSQDEINYRYGYMAGLTNELVIETAVAGLAGKVTIEAEKMAQYARTLKVFKNMKRLNKVLDQLKGLYNRGYNKIPFSKLEKAPSRMDKKLNELLSKSPDNITPGERYIVYRMELDIDPDYNKIRNSVNKIKNYESVATNLMKEYENVGGIDDILRIANRNDLGGKGGAIENLGDSRVTDKIVESLENKGWRYEGKQGPSKVYKSSNGREKINIRNHSHSQKEGFESITVELVDVKPNSKTKQKGEIKFLKPKDNK